MYELSQEQVDQFHEQGYLIVRASEHQLINPDQLRKWTTEVQSWPKEKGKWMPYEEVTASGERILMRTEKFVDYHDQFNELLCGPALRGVLAQISGDVSLLPTSFMSAYVRLLIIHLPADHAPLQRQNQLQTSVR